MLLALPTGIVFHLISVRGMIMIAQVKAGYPSYTTKLKNVCAVISMTKRSDDCIATALQPSWTFAFNLADSATYHDLTL